jgi:hypothetical protein
VGHRIAAVSGQDDFQWEFHALARHGGEARQLFENAENKYGIGDII